MADGSKLVDSGKPQWTQATPAGFPADRILLHGNAKTPGDLRAAQLTVTLRDLVWDVIYAPVGGATWFAADKLSHLQFLTIRQYLSVVFALLTVLLFFLMLMMLVWT